ncbi:hAT family dimerization protein [Rhizoctonia solani 123E]|uniref:HAT family dimerization protein n=1 Tax=Rhizoctonia solani 123E TaxID=1423351 RepID=A0A074SAD3_9AGAM|nr:hAT family dimerization protein [Rhizoctonia solani 123E]
MDYAFTCKVDPERHPIQYRRRRDTSNGTGNLKTSMESCRARNNQCNKPNGIPSTPFSYAMHLAIIVMLCAYHYLPFAGVLHDLIRRHVQLLRPGTSMPNPTTVSRTTRLVYEKQAEKVRTYFQSVDTVHLAIDGWTSPTATSYLGLVVHWYSEGRLWRAVLEMIRMERKHTGEYLAQTTAECFRRYDLTDKLLSVCMDNASNNDTFTRYLPHLIPGFNGPASRVRCAAHVINLVVKARTAFTSHFMSPTRRKRKSVKIKAKSSRKRRRVNKSTNDTIEEHQLLVEEGDPGAGETDSEDEFEVGGQLLPGEATAKNDAKILHDRYVIKDTIESALQYVQTDPSLDITEAMQVAAQSIITKAAKISRMVHEKPELKHKLDQLIDGAFSSLKTARRTLARRVATRWNSDFECLESHRDLRICIEGLIGDPSNNLEHLRLGDYEWLLLNQVVRVLKIFKEVTSVFSQAEVPLVHEVVPIFVSIRRKLEFVRDKKLDFEPIIRIAAHSSLLVLDKYMDLFEDSEVYWIALVMCPNYKLQWLRDNGFTESDIGAVRDLIIRRFNVLYPVDPNASVLRVELAKELDESDDEWDLGVGSKMEINYGLDSIEDYLQTEPVSAMIVGASGGPLKYWESQRGPTDRPRLARFAINYLTAPASSVEAERAFSCGRLTINHLQHQMSSDTFCAKMALRSWYQTPLLNGVEDVAVLLGDGEANYID